MGANARPTARAAIRSSAPIDTLEAAEAYLEGLINFEQAPSYRGARMDLRAIEALMASLGNPEEHLSAIHVAGSKGKGSTSLLIEGLLSSLGERVGTFTSPHLQSWTERFRIAGAPVSGEVLAAAVAQVQPAVEALRDDPDTSPTFFDATTAAAFLLFRAEAVDRAVVEVGLGGRLDSTNCLAPAVTCITTIELEHTEKLGDTLAAIAAEKAGILKAGVPCVIGRLPPEARDVVRARARELAAPLAELGGEFEVETRPLEPFGTRVEFRDRGGFALVAELPWPGEHHAENAAIAIAAIRRLEGIDDGALAEAAAEAFARISLPGRCELVQTAPCVLVDGAHTPDSAAALRRVLDRIPAQRRELVLSVSAGKELDSMLALLLPGVARVTVTRAEPRRSLDPAEVAAAVRRCSGECDVRVIPNPHLALRAARAELGKGDLLCVTGSFYLAGIAREILRDETPPPVQVSRRGKASAGNSPT